jgi:hypothetical protein
MSPYVRTMKTSSGATAVQIVYSCRRGSREIDHLGSAHSDAEVKLLEAAARQRLAAGRASSTWACSRMLMPGAGRCRSRPRGWGHLWDALARGYAVLGLEQAAGGDEVFRDLVLVRIIEPASKLDSARVLEEAGIVPASYPTVCRRLRAYARDSWRRQLAGACVAMPGWARPAWSFSQHPFTSRPMPGTGSVSPGSPRNAGWSRRSPSACLPTRPVFPLMVHAFEGNKAETTTIVPAIRAFTAAHQLADVTVVADAGMISAGNQQAIEDAGLSFILGARISDVPYAVAQWRREHPGQQIPDGHIFTQPWPAGPASSRRDEVIYYQYKADRARRTLRGIDEQVAKAEKAVTGATPVKRNRFVQLSSGTRSVNRTLEARARALAGLKGYVTNLQACPDGTPVTAEFVISAYPGSSESKNRSDGQERLAGPAGLPPQARLHRSAPDHRVRRPGHQPLDRDHHRMEHQEVRPHRPPLPHHHHPGRAAHHHRRRPRPRRPPSSPNQDQQHQPKCALA